MFNVKPLNQKDFYYLLIILKLQNKMFLLNCLLWITLISTLILDTIINSQIYNLQKTPQFPSNNISDRIAIEINDRFLIDAQNVRQTYKYFIYNGEIFDNLVNNYTYDQGTVDDIDFSDDSIFEAISSDSQYIQSVPYQKPIILDISNVSSILSLSSELKLLSVYNYTSDCQYLVTLKEFQEDIQKYVFDEDETSCLIADASLLDIGNGLIAHQKYDTVDIWDKNNLTKKLYSINISSSSHRSYIDDFKIVHYEYQSYSMFAVRIDSENHTIFACNSTYYYKRAQFYYEGECHYNGFTCVSIDGNNLITNQNVDSQLIGQKISDHSLSYMKDNVFFEMTHSSKYILGYNKSGNSINIFNGYSDNIDLNRSIINRFCVVDAKFTYDDSAVIVQNNNCDNHTKSNLCILSPSNKFPIYCLRDSIDNNDSNIDGFIQIIQNQVDEKLNRICVSMSKTGSDFYTVECRSSVDLKPQPQQQSHNEKLQNQLQGYTIIRTKMLHTKQIKNTFWVIISVKSPEGNIQSYAHKYKLERDAQVQKYVIIKKELLEKKFLKVSFNLSGVHKTNLISFHQKTSSSCALFYFGQQGQQIETNLVYDCYYNNEDHYRLILQEDFEWSCLQLKIDAWIDCYKVDFPSKTVKRLIKTPQINSYFQNFKPIINVGQEWILYYQTNSDYPSYIVLDISVLPIFKARLSYSSSLGYYKNQYAYRFPSSSPSGTNDQLLSYTHRQTLYKVRNPVNRMKEIYQQKFHPSEYLFVEEAFPLNYSSPQTLIDHQKTFLASTGYHLIVILYSNSNTSKQIYLSLEQKDTIKPIWIDPIDNYMINDVDLAWNTFSISTTNDSVILKTFKFSLKIEDIQGHSHDDKFTKIKITNDDRLIFIVTNKENVSKLYYMTSILKRQCNQVKLSQTKNIKQLSISTNQDAFLVGSQKSIEYVQFDINTKSTKSYSISLPNGFTAMYLTTNKSTIARNNLIKNKKIEQVSSMLSSKWLINKRQKISSSGQMQVASIQFQPQSDEIKSEQLENLNEGEMSTKIIVTQNCTYFCRVQASDLSDCSKFQSINSKTILAVNQGGNQMAYLWKDQNQSEWVRVVRMKTYSNPEQLQNISLKQLTSLNNVAYKPTAIQLFFSASATIYVLTQSKDDSSFYPVLYVYTPKPCGIDKESKDGQCVCKPYYKTNYKYKQGSLVPEFAECQCNYYLNETSRECQCPTWNGFISTTNQCTCPDDWEEQEDQNNQKVCKEISPFPWYWILFIVLVILVLVPGPFVYCKKKKQCCWKPKTPPGTSLNTLIKHNLLSSANL